LAEKKAGEEAATYIGRMKLYAQSSRPVRVAADSTRSASDNNH